MTQSIRYVSCRVDDRKISCCDHYHSTIEEAANCRDTGGVFVRAIAGDKERALTSSEMRIYRDYLKRRADPRLTRTVLHSEAKPANEEVTEL
jgi:hypothetical protein